MILELERARNLMVNNRDDKVFMSRNYRSDGNLMFFKLAYLVSKLCISGKYLF